MSAVKTALKFSPAIKELRIHLCQCGTSSQGARDFIEQNYVNIKRANPKLPILIRECSGVSPKVWARYEFGKETSHSLENFKPEQISKVFSDIANSA